MLTSALGGFFSSLGLLNEVGKSNEISHLIWKTNCSKVNKNGDFTGGPVVKNPPSNAGDAGSTPGWGTKIPHAAGQLSPCATTIELAHLN